MRLTTSGFDGLPQSDEGLRWGSRCRRPLRRSDRIQSAKSELMRRSRNFFFAEWSSQMTSKRIPFSENSPGDFYVEDGCCTSCGMPSTVSPGLFSYVKDGHCYVSKQPSGGKEVFQMIQAFRVQDIGCIRYKGSNRATKQKLIALGEGDQCDQLDRDLEALNQRVQADRGSSFDWNHLHTLPLASKILGLTKGGSILSVGT